MKKFVVLRLADGELSIRLSNCVECHFELVPKGVECLGGGHFYIDRAEKSIYLYGTSVDHGFATDEVCAKALENTLSNWAKFDYYYSHVEQCPLSLEEVLTHNPVKIYTHNDDY